MNKIFFFCLNISILAFGYVNCDCKNKKVVSESHHRETFNLNSTSNCTEISLGSFDSQKRFVLMFDSRNASIDCSKDKIIVTDENKSKILDYCEKMKKSFLGVKHISKALYVLFIYGSGIEFSVSFDWLSLDVPDSANLLSQTSTLTTTPIQVTKISTINSSFVSSSTADFSVPSTTADFSVPSTTADFSVPSTTADFSVPSTTADFSVPSTTADFSVPSTTADFSVPSTTTLPKTSQHTSISTLNNKTTTKFDDPVYLPSNQAPSTTTLPLSNKPTLTVNTTINSTVIDVSNINNLTTTTSSPTIENITYLLNTTSTKTSTTTSIKPSLENCGFSYYPISTDSLRVIGGGIASPHSYPWQVYLTDYTGRLGCGGSLINHEWILTAAHCVEGKQYLRVYLGAHDLLRSEAGIRKSFYISKIIPHQYYNLFNRLEHDIALLKLEVPINFTKEISPICLPKKAPQPFTSAIVTGWGRTVSGGPVSYILNQVSVTVRERSFCEMIGNIKTTQICAGNTIYSDGFAKDSCQGDSGGPLTVKESDNKYYLNGIVSFGSSTCDGLGVYTNVVSYLEWIDWHIRFN